MHATYHLKASDLNDGFLESIRSLFQDRVIDIAISDVVQPSSQDAPVRKAGALKGRIRIGDDFNAPLADFADYQS